MENYKHLTKEEKYRYWQEHFDRWKESSLSQKKYCEENSISYWSFKNRFGKGKLNQGRPTKKFIQFKPEKLHVGYTGKIEIILENKIRLLIEECICEGNLRKIISALEHSNDK
jgi:hypothetical protein